MPASAQYLSSDGIRTPSKGRDSALVRLKNILVLHNRYRQEGGEDTVVRAEASLLRAKGHRVTLHQVSNVNIEGPVSAALTGLTAPYSIAARTRMTTLIRQDRPDIVHVHNFFPQLTPSIFDAFRDAKIPVVQTLHNYRLICGAATLSRDGVPCEECVGRFPLPLIRHRCYRNSRLVSCVPAAMIALHRLRGTWHSRVSRFIALTNFARSKFIAGGLPADRIAIKPNFADVPAGIRRHSQPTGGLFVGRLSVEKGVPILVDAWSGVQATLTIVGDGPLGDVVRTSGGQVTHVGWQDRMMTFEAMANAAFIVIPSVWYEGFPMVLAEAFGVGVPVIASRIGGLGELITDGVTGLLARPGDAQDLRRKVIWALDHPQSMAEMAENARRMYDAEFTPDRNYEQLLAVYESAMGQS